MDEKEKFARFKNRLLGTSFLNDGTHFAEVLGRDDFIFWERISEKAPYTTPLANLSDTEKGQIILERLEIEPSPKRMAELLQAVYGTFAFYSMTPIGDMDDHWRQFSSWLGGLVDSVGLSEFEMKWIREPEECFTPKPVVEKYYLPGQLQISYLGTDWATEESKNILVNGFNSRVYSVALNKKNDTTKVLLPKKNWFLLLCENNMFETIIGGLVVVAVAYYLGWK